MTLLKEELLTEVEVAEILQYSPKTLTKNRSIGKRHPPFRKVGKNIFYLKEEVLAWLKSQNLKEEKKK